MKKTIDFATQYYRFWCLYRTDFGAQCVIVLQTLPSSTEEANKALIVREDSTDYNRLYCPITAQTLAVKITDFGANECVAV